MLRLGGSSLNSSFDDVIDWSKDPKSKFRPSSLFSSKLSSSLTYSVMMRGLWAFSGESETPMLCIKWHLNKLPLSASFEFVFSDFSYVSQSKSSTSITTCGRGYSVASSTLATSFSRIDGSSSSSSGRQRISPIWARVMPWVAPSLRRSYETFILRRQIGLIAILWDSRSSISLSASID